MKSLERRKVGPLKRSKKCVLEGLAGSDARQAALSLVECGDGQLRPSPRLSWPWTRPSCQPPWPSVCPPSCLLECLFTFLACSVLLGLRLRDSNNDAQASTRGSVVNTHTATDNSHTPTHTTRCSLHTSQARCAPTRTQPRMHARGREAPREVVVPKHRGKHWQQQVDDVSGE